MGRPQIIVLTPIRDEAWILKRFLECTSLWADHIIIADQHSDDDSRAVAQAFPKVTVIENPNREFSEVARQKLLIEAARRIPGPRLLMALDADELMSANILDSAEWQTALQARPGTVLCFSKVDLFNSPAYYFLHSAKDRAAWLPFGYVDDGAEHEGEVIHTTRVPSRPRSPSLRLNEVVLLHYNQCNLPRMESKDRWYRCFARVNTPEQNVVEIHRLHDWYDRLRPKFEIRPTPEEWFGNYRREGIELSGIAVEPFFWSDWEVLRMFKQYGADAFRSVDIWSFDWEALRQEGVRRRVAGIPEEPIRVPLRRRDRWLHAALMRTRHYAFRPYTDKLLKRLAAFVAG
jgi:Glycosyl transferase family 2